MPVHGEYRMLKRHSELAQELGMPAENIFVMQTGQVLELDKNSAKVTTTIIRPSSDNCFLSLKTIFPTSPTPNPSTNTFPIGTVVVTFAEFLSKM